MSVNDPRQALFECLEAATLRAGETGDAAVFPGGVALVLAGRAELYHEAHGVMATHEAAHEALRAVRRDTIYDLASLTKVLATATLAAIAVAEGRVALDAPVPAAWARGCPGACMADLLAHCSGLPAHREFFVDFALARPGRADEIVARVAAVDPAYPLRAQAVYSDLGFILLGAWLERIFGDPLDRLFADRVAWPLGLDRRPLPRIGFQRLGGARGPSAAAQAIVAPTEVYDLALHAGGEAPSYFPLRRAQGVAHHEVHDDNALVMGGVAGHAGLFGDAEAVATIARAWIDGEIPGLDRRTRDRFWEPSPIPGSTRRLGWDGASAEGSTGGALSPAAVGHLGFTGTSVWIDPVAVPERVYVLLSNRVHPTRTRAAIVALRPAFHRLAARL